VEAVRVRCCHAGLHPANISLDRACQNPCSTLVMTTGASLPIHLFVPSRHSCRIFQANLVAGRVAAEEAYPSSTVPQVAGNAVFCSSCIASLQFRTAALNSLHAGASYKLQRLTRCLPANPM
jgi:hypothetical protein